MKTKLDLFKKAEDLLNKPEVKELSDYCEQLEDELVEFKFEKEKQTIDYARHLIRSS